MRIHLPRLGILSLVIFGFGCAPQEQAEGPTPEEAAAADAQAIRDLGAAWGDAMATGDAAAILNLYADGAVGMPPYEPAISGKQALGPWFEEFLAPGLMDVVLETEEVALTGDWAFVRGTYSFQTEAEEGAEPMTVAGKWVSLDQRQADGSWKVVRNLWNTDAPPAGLEAMPVPAAADVPVATEPMCVTEPTGLDQAFVTTFTEGDLANLLAIHAEDGMRLPPGMPAVEGRAALAGFLGSMIEYYPKRDLKVMQAGAVPGENHSAAWGTYEFMYTPAEGEPMSGRGKYIAVGTLAEDGCWRADFVIWNSDSLPESVGA